MRILAPTCRRPRRPNKLLDIPGLGPLLLRTTVAPTMLQAGFVKSVIPAEAQATLDIRALPDEDMNAFADQMRALIDDSQIEVKPLRVGPPAPPSSHDTEMFRALEKAQRKLYPDAITIPTMSGRATDSVQLREKGVQAYGISPPSGPQGGRAHGHDEAASIDGMREFLEFPHLAVIEVAASNMHEP